MGKGRALLDAVSVSIALVVMPGLVMGAHSVFANQHLAHGHVLLAWLELSDWVSRLGHPVAMVVVPLLLVFLVVLGLSGRKESDPVPISVMLLLAMLAAVFVDVLLRCFTHFSLGLAIERTWFRLKTGTAPSTFGGGIGAIVLTYAAALAGVVLVIVGAVWLKRWLRWVNLPRPGFGRWFPRRAVYSLAAAALIGAIAVNLFAVVGLLRMPTDKPNVILICVDTLRADALGYSGYSRNTSPFIDSLAERSIVFRNAESQSSWTGPSVASYLTSEYSVYSRMTTTIHRLPRSAVTVSEVLRNGGYETGAIIANPLIKREFGFGQGFEYFDESRIRSWRIDTSLISRFLERRRSRPFFLYIHFMDVHHPYLAPEPYFDMFAAAGGNYRTENGPMPDLSPEDLSYTRALYDGEIRFLDEKLRSLFAFLDSSPSMKNSVVIFMADHGEEFHEHGGMGHGTSLYGELVNIPLMIVASGALDAATHDINDPVRGVDVMPTILEIAGMSIPPNVDGRSLLARVRGRELAPAASLAGVISRGNGDRLFSISHNGYRYIHNLTQGYGELYNVSRDPLNQNNLVDSNPEIAAEMKATLMRRVAGFVAVGDTESEEPVLDKETLENLEALGYL